MYLLSYKLLAKWLIIMRGLLRALIPRGKRANIVNVCLQKSFLWPSLRVLSLRLNMRVRTDDHNRRFVEWVVASPTIPLRPAL